MSGVLVTGASGTVGRWCVDALRERGVEVHAVAGPSSESGVDLLRPGAAVQLVEQLRPVGLVHLAWETRHGVFWEAPENDAWVEASAALVGAAVATGCRRVVVAGTCAEYDWSPAALGDGTCVESSTRVVPATRYGLAKAALHRRLEHDLRVRDVTLAWGRVFSLYGAGEDDRRLVPSVARALLRGEPAGLSEGSQIRDYLDARDVGRGFAALYSSEVTGAVNVASGVDVSVRELATRLATIAGAVDLLRFDATNRPQGPPRLVAAVDRIRDEVGFEPTIDLDSGLRDALDWWRRRLSA